MSVWRWVRGLFVPEAPPPPEALDAESAARAAAETRRAAERAERLARDQELRLRQLEERLRLYERRSGDGGAGGAA